MTKDLNDRFREGTLPDDPAEGETVMAADVPRVLTTGDLLRGAYQRAHATRARAGCTTGHYRLDAITGGLRPGFVWVFGADTSWGKSSFLVSVADENLRAGRRVLIVSAEDSEHVYADRLMARRARVSASRLRSRSLLREESEACERVVRENLDHPVYVDGRGRSAEWLAKRTREVIRDYQIEVVAFDYLQALGTDKRSQDRRNEMTWCARVLTDTIKSAGVSGIIFSQVTIQEGKSRPDKHSIRDSRDVLNASELCLIGFTPDKPLGRLDRDGKAEVVADAGQKCISVEKNKDGPSGAILPMAWNEHSACFDAVRDPESERLQSLQDSVGYHGDN